MLRSQTPSPLWREDLDAFGPQLGINSSPAPALQEISDTWPNSGPGRLMRCRKKRALFRH